MSDVYVAEITAYDPSVPGVITLRYSNTGFTTGGSDTPAHTHFAERIINAATLQRFMFADGTTRGRTRTTYGDLVLANGDGELDALKDYGFDGRDVIIRRGSEGAAYPSGFTKVLTATMEQAELTRSELTIRIRDKQEELNKPLQATKYDGDNVLPAGLEGVASDLKGKPKPLCYGVVKNISPPCVNTSKLIYQVNDGAVDSVDAVYDRGVPLGIPGNPSFTEVTTTIDTTWTLTSAAFGDAVFLITGGAGTLATSEDFGATWKQRVSSFGTDTIRASAYGAAVYVAGGGAGKLASSPDGVVWTQRTSTFGSDIVQGIAWGEADSLFVAVGGAQVATSPDGTTWTSRTSSFAGGDIIVGVAHGGGLFVAVGGTDKAAYSSDGVTWTQASTGLTGMDFSEGGVAYGAGVFVAGGSSTVAVSADGDTWAQHTSGLTGFGALGAISFGGGLFVAVSVTGKIATSEDGETWTQLASSPFDGAFALGVAYGDGHWVACGQLARVATASATGRFYASEADLLDDTLEPAPGAVGVYLAGGLIRLGSSPDGQVTADVTEGDTASDRTTGQIWARVLTEAGVDSGEYSASDVDALDSLNDAEIGIWIDEETTVTEVLDEIAGTVGAWWGADKDGVFRIGLFDGPTGVSQITFTANDMVEPLERVPVSDEGRGIPVWRYKLRYGKNYTVQTSDIAAAVTDARRAFLAKEWREVVASDATVQTAHILAPEIVADSLFAEETDAQTEATRQLTLRKVHRDMYEFATPLDDDTDELDIGDVVTIEHSRFDLVSGGDFVIIGVEPDAMARLVRFRVWG